MADVEYTINYDETNGLSTSQVIKAIGTSPDRVRFVTGKEKVTITTAGQTEVVRMALSRDMTKNPDVWPLTGIPDPYPIPLGDASGKWIDVHNAGHEQFHYICGYVDDKGKFRKWSDYIAPHTPVQPSERRSGVAVRRAPASSLPWPT